MISITAIVYQPSDCNLAELCLNERTKMFMPTPKNC